jgi:hypothetical protein
MFRPPAGPRRIPTALMVLLPVLALVLGGLIGAGLGAGIAAATTHRHGPAGPPPLAADFPNASRQYLPGVTVSMISQDWLVKANKWTCGPADNKPAAGAKKEMECAAPGDQKYDLYVDIAYDAEDKVRLVTAWCNYGPGAHACETLFGTFADAVLIPQKELRKQGYDWASKNADSDESTTIGGVRFEASLSPHNMDAMPAG